MKSKFVRMKMSTFKELRRIFKAKRGESASSYFDRLAQYLRDLEDIEKHQIIPPITNSAGDYMF